MAVKRIRLVKITLLAAFEADEELFYGAGEAGLEGMADDAAELLRSAGALTAASDYASAHADVHQDDDDDLDIDDLLDALNKRFPDDGLVVGPVPGVHVLGRNGSYKHARLERNGDHIELWLGTPTERYPFVEFPAVEIELANYPVPAGKQRREGVEYGCGLAACADCYEPKTRRAR